MVYKHRKGSRKGELGDTDEAHLFLHLYEQDTADDSTLRNRWNSLSNDEQEYILFQMGESRQDFEETFNQSSYEGSRKGAASFATSGFDRAVNGITGTLKSKPVMNTLKRTTGTKDQRNQVIIENNANKEAKASRQKKVNEIRKGSGPLCDMGNISGKEPRPDNLGQISSGIVSARKRSIRLEGEYNQQSRKGSRRGSSIWTLKGS